MKKNRRQLGRGALELIEEAVHLLRMNGAAALAAYYLGSLPFVLALLYFWADMSRSPFAAQELPGGALWLALLFLWMKFWQTFFTHGMRARISALPQPRWDFRRCLRVFVIQTAIQPSAVIIMPLALLPLAMPFPWVYTFYQNVTALTDGESGEISKVFKRASKQSRLWPSQNLAMLGILFVFALFVFLNLGTFCFLLPQLLKMLLGIDSVYTQSPWSMFNSTLTAALCALTYLCVDPIVKTVYLLRCFYGESLQSGEDLKAELKQYSQVPGSLVALLMLALFFTCATCRAADETTPAPAPAAAEAKTVVPAVSPQALDKTINQVIHEPKYTWRMPREKTIDASLPDNPVSRFLHRVWGWVKPKIKATLDWLGDWWDKLFKRNKPTTPTISTGFDWVRSLKALLVVLFVVIITALAIILFNVLRRRYRPAPVVSSQPVMPPPDLADENVAADQLPEDGWITMGRELLGRGELRLALRAFYFASLAHLATRNLITIAKFKSNRDYERELRRRGHSLPNLLSLFGENVSTLDSTWYGMHEIDQEVVNRFLANVERIKAV